jgi:hypothetical protein
MTLDDPKRGLYLSPDAGLELLQLVTQGMAGFAFVQRFALACCHCILPVHISVMLLDLLALFNAPVTLDGKDHFLLAVQQGMRLGDVVSVGRSVCDRVQSVHTNVNLLSKVLLVALLALVYLRVSLALVVLGRTGRSN